eukprot:scaffold56734_cov41-Cyclotella_meneghiniana.AAC.1
MEMCFVPINDSNSDMVLLIIGWTMLKFKSTSGAKTNSRSAIPRCGISKLWVCIISPEGNNVLSLMPSISKMSKSMGRGPFRMALSLKSLPRSDSTCLSFTRSWDGVRCVLISTAPLRKSG